MLVCNIYVDHQEFIKYPVDYITKDLDFVDKICLYGGDDTSVAELRNMEYDHKNINIENIGIKIKDPTDIATAQNACMKRSFESERADFVLTLQADVKLTTAGKKLILEYLESVPRSSYHFTIEHNKLFHKCGLTTYGASIAAKNNNALFVGDGAYMMDNDNNQCAYGFRGNIIAVLDIGYLTPEIAARKHSRHKLTWRNASFDESVIYKISDFYGRWLKMMELYRGVETLPLIDLDNDTEWVKVLHDFKVYDHFLRVKKHYDDMKSSL